MHNIDLLSKTLVTCIIIIFSAGLIHAQNRNLNAETFDADVLVHGTSAPTTVWFAPDYNPPIAHTATGGCTGGCIGYAGSWNDYWGNFVRLPEVDCSGYDTVVLSFDVSHSYFASHPDDWCRFYIWADGGYVHNVISVYIDDADETYDSGMNGKGFEFSEVRSCASVEVKFDMDAISDQSNLLLYIEPSCGYNDSESFYVWFDNISVTASGAPEPPEPDLGTDQNLCNADLPVILDPGVYDDYLWNTNETTQTIEVDETGTYSVTVTEGGLTGSDEVNITVLPDPVAPTTLTPDDDSVCEGTSGNMNITASGGSGDVLRWFTGGCGGTEIGTGNPLNVPIPASTTTYYARWENTCGESGCAQTDIVVVPDAVVPVDITSDTNNVCSGETIPVTLTANGGSGDEVHWFSGSCGGADLGYGNPLIVNSPAVTTIYYARWENTCGVSSCVSKTINVIQSTDATIDPAGPFCETASQEVLNAAESGGTWSGTGVEPGTGEFNPQTAGPGQHLISYTIPDPCGDSDQITITVDENLDATIDPAGPFCSDEAPVTLTAASSGGAWSGPGITDSLAGTFDPSVAGIGNHNVTYSFNGACANSDQVSIEVQETADATIDPAGPFCETASQVVLNAAESGGTWSGTGVDPVTGEFNPQTAGPGQHLISYTIPDPCGDSDQITITVDENL
ncbi:MAG: hypothetical protein R6V32_06200, partial [Bacteroidales bacterium]